MENKKFTWYDKVDQRQPTGVINFDMYEVDLLIPRQSDGNKTLFCLIIKDVNQKFEFKAESEDQAKMWQQIIYQNKIISTGFKEKISAKNIKNPHLYEAISESQFI